MKKNKTFKLLGIFICTFVLLTMVQVKQASAAITKPTVGDNYAYFFKDGQYVMYDLTADKQVAGYPSPVNSTTWPGLPWTTIDAAFTNPANPYKGFIFKGNQYVRYDYATDMVESGYPKAINNSTWPGLPFSSVDAIIPSNNGKVYFIKGNQYARYDMNNDRVDPGYPLDFNSANWPGVPWTGIDSAVTTANNICYLFKGNQYIKYDLNLDKAIQGINPINGANWPGLTITNNIKGSLTVGKGKFIQPLYGTITSEYGYRVHPITGDTSFHTGIDIAAPTGTEIKASAGGKVVKAEYHSSYGNHVIIDHGGGIKTLYAHSSQLKVSVGQTVSQGQVIALVGSTGNSTGPHCHFEVRVNEKDTNPRSYVNIK